VFADTGLSEAAISALFAIWSGTAVVAEVPCGALADRVSRRGALVAAGVLQALGYAIWMAAPGFAGFATGFVLWGVSGSLAGGAFNALLYDGLAATGAAERFGPVLGRCEAAAQLVQVPVAIAATLLSLAGGHAAVAAVSVAVCLLAAALATGLPDRRPAAATDTGELGREGYLATLTAGMREAAVAAPVRAAVAAVALLTAFDGLEEYFPLVAAQRGVPAEAIPLALLAVPLAGAAGSALGGGIAHARAPVLAGLLLIGAAGLGAAGAVPGVAGIAGLAVFYGVGRAAQVIAETRMQERVTGRARATVTAVSTLGAEIAGIALFAVWAAGGLPVVTALAVAAALLVPRWLRRGRVVRRGDDPSPGIMRP
jgi:hypothetical protein